MSAHVYLHESIYSAAADDLIVRVVTTVKKRCASALPHTEVFFVRFHDGRSHVRIRVGRVDQGGSSRAKGIVEDTVRRYVKESSDGKSAFTLAATGVSLEWNQYVPEIERYGGVQGVPIAERLFCASSGRAIAAVKATPGSSRAMRLSNAAHFMLYTLAVFWPDRTDAARIATSYGEGYTSHLREGKRMGPLIERLNRHVEEEHHAAQVIRRKWRAATGEVRRCFHEDAYVESLVRTRAAWEQICAEKRGAPVLNAVGTSFDGVVASYMHMMNNRLGITMFEEAFLGRLVGRALS